MKYSLAVTPLSVSGWVRMEVALFLAHVIAWRTEHADTVGEVHVEPKVNVVPAPCARNQAVRDARERGADYLCMVDDDMAPGFDFLPAALAFLRDHHGPAVVASPYCSAAPKEDVMVFQWCNQESGTAAMAHKIERLRREDASRRTGIGRCDNVGTGFVLYDMRVFDRIKPPWFNYTVSADGTAVVETEDCHVHRKLAASGIPLYVDWDHWSGHWKPKCVQKPVAVTQEQINETYVEQAGFELVKMGWKPPAPPAPQRNGAVLAAAPAH